MLQIKWFKNIKKKNNQKLEVKVVDNLNNSVYDNVRIFVGQRDPEAANIHDENEDGKYYIFDDVQVEFYGDSATPDYVQVDTLDTMSSKMSRMNHKIRLMELKREMNL